MSENENLLTVPQAAEVLGVTQGAIRNALYRGMLPHSHRYGRRLVALSDLNAYYAQSHPNGHIKRGRPSVTGTPEISMRTSVMSGSTPTANPEDLTLAELMALPPEQRDAILALSMKTFVEDFADDDVRDFEVLDTDGLDDIDF